MCTVIGFTDVISRNFPAIFLEIVDDLTISYYRMVCMIPAWLDGSAAQVRGMLDPCAALAVLGTASKKRSTACVCSVWTPANYVTLCTLAHKQFSSS
jgi:hypothetical protein